MDLTTTLTQNVDTLFTNLESFTQNEGVLGKPVSFGDKTFIPVVSVALGYGTGNTANNKQQTPALGTNASSAISDNNMSGGAVGLGAKLTTEAVIVIDNNDISMLPMANNVPSSSLVDKIPQMLMGMNQNKQQGQQQSQQQSQGQGQQS